MIVVTSAGPDHCYVLFVSLLSIVESVNQIEIESVHLVQEKKEGIEGSKVENK